MAKLTLTSITSGYSAPSAINANNAAVVAAMEKTLSRDGTSPNNMEADLDMDSNRILNLPEPVADQEPVRLMDLAGEGVTATIAANATAAAASATAAAASATAAATSATAASTSATTASTQASNASSSASAAASSAAAAATSASQQLFRDVVFKTYADSPITITSSDAGKLFAIDATGGAVSITLPAIAGLTLSSPWSVSVKKTDSSGNSITINRASTDTIDGATSKVVSSSGAGVTLIPDTDPSPDEWTSASFGATAGNLTVDVFTAGVHFTAGSTTSLTASVAPGSENNSWIYFDGQYQEKSEYSVSGAVFTFSSAIPLGVSRVEIVVGSTLSVGTPADGTVTTVKIVDSAVTTAKIADANVTTAKIADGAVTAAKQSGVAYGQGVLAKDGSSLKLSPANGNQLTINSVNCTIPDAGVTLAVGALSNSTLYYVYAYMNSGTMTLEASTTAYATQAGTGVKIKSGDATRTLVGMCYLIGGAFVDSVTQRFVRSWFNDKGIDCRNTSTAGSTASASFVEMSSSNRSEFLCWSGEVVECKASGTHRGTNSGSAYAGAVGVDGTSTKGPHCQFHSAGAYFQMSFSSPYVSTGLSEGYHYATWLGICSSSTGTYDSGDTVHVTVTTGGSRA